MSKEPEQAGGNNREARGSFLHHDSDSDPQAAQPGGSSDAPGDRSGPEQPDELPESFQYIDTLADEHVPESVAEEQAEAEAEAREHPGAPPTPPEQPYIAFEHISKAFGDLHVLDDVSFFVNTGETLCILGRSGVGKSVSLQMIMGFLKPDAGTILVAEENICGYDEARMQGIRKKVTMVFQNGALFDSLSVRENVAFPLRDNRTLAEDQIQQIVTGLLEMVGVAAMAELTPADLSTGMKRSVAIARALAAQPKAILYDEPTTMVDPLIAKRLGDLIQKLKHQLNLTSIVVTHDMRFARKLANRVLFLHEGKARFFGTMDEMKQSKDEILCQFLELDELVLPL
jgi:phospholipid/cholesterol/gamma-HCH transport system ATP-binding protein